MSHTPGPWTVLPDGYRVAKCDMQAKTFDSMVCVTAHNSHERTETARANACLIAAAPDLLEACKSISKDGWDWLTPEAYDMLQAAIAKAEGR